MIVDSHFHTLSMMMRGEALPESLIGIDISLKPGDYEERRKVLPDSLSVFASTGAGPWCLDDKSIGAEELIKLVRNDMEEYSLDAVGEAGPDNYHSYGTPEEQEKLFLGQAEIARDYKVPLIIHSRDAYESTFKAIPTLPTSVFHCFSYDVRMAEKALSYGHYISFAGNITYKNSENLREAAKIVPEDRILVETDSPYLAPVPMRGRVSNPSFTEYTLELIAKLRKIDKEELKLRITENLYAVLGKRTSSRVL